MTTVIDYDYEHEQEHESRAVCGKALLRSRHH